MAQSFSLSDQRLNLLRPSSRWLAHASYLPAAELDSSALRKTAPCKLFLHVDVRLESNAVLTIMAMPEASGWPLAIIQYAI